VVRSKIGPPLRYRYIMETLAIESAPSMTLSSGLNVVNFSSPHPFNFESGEILSGCSPERSRALSMGSDDVTKSTTLPNGKVVELVTKRFTMTEGILRELYLLQNNIHVDVILVPFPTLQGLQASGEIGMFSKVATIFVVNRETKAISNSKFCQ